MTPIESAMRGAQALPWWDHENRIRTLERAWLMARGALLATAAFAGGAGGPDALARLTGG